MPYSDGFDEQARTAASGYPGNARELQGPDTASSPVKTQLGAFAKLGMPRVRDYSTWKVGKRVAG